MLKVTMSQWDSFTLVCAGHILSSSRENVEDTPSGEQVHEAAKVSYHFYTVYMFTHIVYTLLALLIHD
jgi:hypothetical protein